MILCHVREVEIKIFYLDTEKLWGSDILCGISGPHHSFWQIYLRFQALGKMWIVEQILWRLLVKIPSNSEGPFRQPYPRARLSLF